MSYVADGVGDPVLFLHGNPTWSFLWRNVIGPVALNGRRCLALDLMGMGRSDKPDIEYRLIDHIAYVDAFIDAVNLDTVTLVGHDWGAVIALHYARRFPDRVNGVAVLEGHIHPIERWDDLDDGARALFSQLRTPGVGEQRILQDNMFIEEILPAGTLRTLTSEEMNAYREPFLLPETRKPMLRWVREIPIDGSPADVAEIVLTNQDVIRDPNVATLLMHASPGAVITETEVAWCRTHGRSHTVTNIGPGIHFLPEDRPAQIAAGISRWLDKLDSTRTATA